MSNKRYLYSTYNSICGVPAMVQWVKNLTVVSWVAAEVWVQSLAWCSGLKALAFMQLQ